MKNVKRVLALVLCLIMVCSLCAVFAGCSYNVVVKDMRQQIEELQTQLSSQQEAIDQQQYKIDELENENENFASQIDDLENEKDNLVKLIDELEQQVYVGKFYYLEDAYDKGMITRDDLQAIADYHNNVTVCDEQLSNLVATLIKGQAAFDLRNRDKNPILEARSKDITIVKYYGEYNGNYAVILDNPYILSPAVERWQDIDGVKIYYTYWTDIVIWGIK